MVFKKNKVNQQDLPVIIHLKETDDLVAIIEALRFNEVNQIVLVIPSQSLALENFFSFRLLKHMTQVLQKQLILVSVDQKIQHLGHHFDITVVKQVPTPKDLKKLDDFKKQELANFENIPKLDSQQTFSFFNFKKNGLIWFLITLLLIGALAIVYFLWPRTAVINVTTDSETLSVNIQADLSKSIKAVDLRNQVVPMQVISYSDRLESEIKPNGFTQGVKASGALAVTNCHPNNNLVIHKDVIFRRDGKDFVLSDQSIDIVINSNGSSLNDCVETIENRKSFTITAKEIGSDYNSSGGSYQLIGVNHQDYQAQGLNISGGQDAANCVSSNDLKIAKTQLSQRRNDERIKKEMVEDLKADGYLALPETFQFALDEINQPPLCPNLGAHKISRVIIYYMGGVKETDLDELLRNELQKVAGSLSILDNGLKNISTNDLKVYKRVVEGMIEPQPTLIKEADLDYYLVLDVRQAKGGVVLDESEILNQSKGKAKKVVGADLRRLEGVKTVDISVSPFWVNVLPKTEEDIVLKIENSQ